MKRVVASLLVVSWVAALGAVDGKKAMYVGGTVTAVTEGVEGKLETASETHLTFIPDKSKNSVSISWESISALDTGKKLGVELARRSPPRYSLDLLVSSHSSPRSVITILRSATPISRARPRRQCPSWARTWWRTTLTVVETRSGKQIEYQDDEARKASKGK